MCAQQQDRIPGPSPGHVSVAGRLRACRPHSTPPHSILAHLSSQRSAYLRARMWGSCGRQGRSSTHGKRIETKGRMLAAGVPHSPARPAPPSRGSQVASQAGDPSSEHASQACHPPVPSLQTLPRQNCLRGWAPTAPCAGGPRPCAPRAPGPAALWEPGCGKGGRAGRGTALRGRTLAAHSRSCQRMQGAAQCWSLARPGQAAPHSRGEHAGDLEREHGPAQLGAAAKAGCGWERSAHER